MSRLKKIKMKRVVFGFFEFSVSETNMDFLHSHVHSFYFFFFVMQDHKTPSTCLDFSRQFVRKRVVFGFTRH